MPRGSATVIFWGTRGSIAVPGRSTLRYGGNTPCVEIRQGSHRLILDGGTGIRPLGLKGPWNSQPIPILVTHTHADHIGGIPFFLPAIRPGHSIRIYGPQNLKKALQHLFPFSVLRSSRNFIRVGSHLFRVGPFRISPHPLNHPGGALGYRIFFPHGRSLVYISDHEPGGRKEEASLAQWADGADLLIMDSQYFDHEYRQRQGWGHSPISYTARFATAIRAKRLILFHHNPGHSDPTLEAKKVQAQRFLQQSTQRIRCQLAREGATIRL